MRNLPLLLTLLITSLCLASVKGQDGAPEKRQKQAAAAAAEAAQPAPVALWYGEMETGKRQFRFVIERLGDGDPPKFQLLSLDEGHRRFPLDRVIDDGQRFEFDLNLTGAKYAGTISDAVGKATGKWQQRGQEYELVFQRIQDGSIPVPDEVWAGTLEVLGQKLELHFRIYQTGEGQKSVRMDSVTQLAGGFAGELLVDGAHWSIKIPAVRGKYEGEMNAETGVITGNWMQNGLALAMKLSKRDPQAEPRPPPKKNRPQTPQAPFPYDVEPVTFANASDNISLAGTLTIPASAGRHPAVILISGSGPQDRDETLLGHKPFFVIADHLTRRGIAVLRYDDRGVGGSQGDFSAATSSDFADDTESAIEFLKQHPRIDPARVVLVGHSEGGIVAAMVGGRRSDLAGIVLLAGTGVNGAQILLSQAELIARAEGVADEKVLGKQHAVQSALIDLVTSSPVDMDSKELTKQALEKLATAFSADEMKEHRLEELLPAGIEKLNSPWFRYFLTFEPASSLRQVRCPVLALNGEKDVQVDPKLNLPAIKKALQEGGNTAVTIRELPGLNHLFQTSAKGAVSEYDAIEETIAPSALQALTEWLQEQLLR